MDGEKQPEEKPTLEDYRTYLKGLRRWFYEIAVAVARKSGICWASIEWWMRRTGLKRSTVYKVLADLCAEGWLVQQKAEDHYGRKRRKFVPCATPDWLSGDDPWSQFGREDEADEESLPDRCQATSKMVQNGTSESTVWTNQSTAWTNRPYNGQKERQTEPQPTPNVALADSENSRVELNRVELNTNRKKNDAENFAHAQRELQQQGKWMLEGKCGYCGGEKLPGLPVCSKCVSRYSGAADDAGGQVGTL